MAHCGNYTQLESMKKYRRHKKVISKEKRQDDTINYSVGTNKKDFELKVQKKMQKRYRVRQWDIHHFSDDNGDLVQCFYRRSNPCPKIHLHFSLFEIFLVPIVSKCIKFVQNFTQLIIKPAP